MPTCGRPRTRSATRLLARRHVRLDGVRERVDAEWAVTVGGAPTVSSGSQIAWRGIRCGLATPIFISVFGSVMTDTGVASEPVPAVVGSAISGTTGPGTDCTG